MEFDADIFKPSIYRGMSCNIMHNGRRRPATVISVDADAEVVEVKILAGDKVKVNTRDVQPVGIRERDDTEEERLVEDAPRKKFKVIKPNAPENLTGTPHALKELIPAPRKEPFAIQKRGGPAGSSWAFTTNSTVSFELDSRVLEGTITEINGLVATVKTAETVINVELSSCAPHWVHNYSQFQRELTDASPRREYQSSSAAPFTSKSLPFGQRKLLLSEIEFLTFCVDKYRGQGRDILAVYAGAADGKHIPFLLTLFPQVKAILVDPSPFHVNVTSLVGKSSQLLGVVNDIFRDANASQLKAEFPDHIKLLISDIRSFNPRETNAKETSEGIMRDNNMQARWPELLDAEESMLKFHPPYPDQYPEPTIQYFPGKLLFGVWAPRSSTEVRLIVTREERAEKRTYDNKQFEEQLYFYNTDNRYQRDCAAEFAILFNYISTFKQALPFGERVRQAVDLSAQISESLQTAWFLPLQRTEREMRDRFGARPIG